MLTLLSDLFCRSDAAVNGAAAAAAALLSMVDYIYDGYGMMNYNTVHAVQHSSTLTDALAPRMRIWLACACL